MKHFVFTLFVLLFTGILSNSLGSDDQTSKTLTLKNIANFIPEEITNVDDFWNVTFEHQELERLGHKTDHYSLYDSEINHYYSVEISNQGNLIALILPLIDFELPDPNLPLLPILLPIREELSNEDQNKLDILSFFLSNFFMDDIHMFDNIQFEVGEFSIEDEPNDIFIQLNRYHNSFPVDKSSLMISYYPSSTSTNEEVDQISINNLTHPFLSFQDREVLITTEYIENNFLANYAHEGAALLNQVTGELSQSPEFYTYEILSLKLKYLNRNISNRLFELEDSEEDFTYTLTHEIGYKVIDPQTNQFISLIALWIDPETGEIVGGYY